MQVHVDDDIADLVPGFLTRRRRDVQRIRAAIDEGNFAVARKLGHDMKGTAGAYGFDAIEAAGRDLEAAAIGRDLDAMRRATDRLDSHLSTVSVVTLSGQPICEA